MKKINFLFLSFFLVFSSVFAQNKSSTKFKYVPGRLVEIGGDTLKGYIGFPKAKENPRSITFKQNLSEPGKLFDSKTMSYFEIEGKGSFEKAEVLKDMRSVTATEISGRTVDSYVKDTVFLKVVVKGSKLNLFQLIDSKYHYYIQQQGGGFEELIYRLELTPGDSVKREILSVNQVNSVFTFRRQLENLIPAGKDPQLFSLIERARYFESELRKIVLQINK